MLRYTFRATTATKPDAMVPILLFLSSQLSQLPQLISKTVAIELNYDGLPLLLSKLRSLSTQAAICSQ